jgi:hypothetical protein
MGDVDGERPGLGLVSRFTCAAFGGKIAEFAGELVLWPVEGVAIEGAGARVHPDGRRSGRGRDEFAEQQRRLNTGVEDLAAIFRIIAAVDGASREVNDGIAAVYLAGPGAPV